jgi:4-hydroxy-2-oxoheptanedioate aldolase
MTATALRARLLTGESLVGVLAPHRDPVLAEQLGLLGIDYYMMDAEHGALAASDAETLVRGCESVGVAPLARVRSLDPKLILQFLDAGVQGIMLPGVTSREEVAALVDAVKYPPHGHRGLGPARAAGYLLGGRSQADYLATANARTLVLPQIEDIRAVERVEALVQVPGIDGVVIGPVDLALSMGFLDGPAHPEVSAAMERVVGAAHAAGVAVGTVARTGAQARALLTQGYRIVLAPIGALLANAVTPYLAEARAAEPAS